MGLRRGAYRSVRQAMKIDIGCGAKKNGADYVGLDFAAAPGVDHIVNLLTDRFPFADRSVDEVFSSHCLEHLNSPNNVWREISRVIKPGGRIEIWTPWPWHDDQHLIGHVATWGPARWRHLSGGPERHFYSEHFLGRGYWRWIEARYVIDLTVKERFERAGLTIEMAVKHHINTVTEWGCFFEYCLQDPGEHVPVETYAHGRGGDVWPLVKQGADMAAE